MSELNRTIFVTGGHITPALAVIEEIRAVHPTWHIVFIGRKYAFEGKRVVSEEYQLVQDAGIPFHSITTGRLQRWVGVWTVLSLLKFPIGFLESLWYVWRYQPSITLSFGGYIALPVVLATRFFRRPVVTHEQTAGMGLANRIISGLSCRVCLSARTHGNTRTSKVILYTGIPLRKQLRQSPVAPPFHVDEQMSMLYITGGATGSQSLNALVFPILHTLVSRFALVHQTGRLDFPKAQALRQDIPPAKQSRYIPLAYVDGSTLSWILHRCVFVVGRSGANTVAELETLGIPAVFIPLPWAGQGEQEANAMRMAASGAAVVMDQKRLTPMTLLAALDNMMANVTRYKTRAMSAKNVDNWKAASRVVSAVEHCLQQ